MTAPTITTKTWTGASSERYTYQDQNRITGNINTVLTWLGLPTVSFQTAERKDQFMISEANAIEAALDLMAGIYSIDYSRRSWRSGTPVDYSDFQRWESALESIIETAEASSGYIKGFTCPEVPAEGLDTTDWTWSIKYSSTVLASGTGLPRTAAVLRSNSYALTYTVAGYGQTYTGTITAGASDTIITVSAVCDVGPLGAEGAYVYGDAEQRDSSGTVLYKYAMIAQPSASGRQYHVYTARQATAIDVWLTPESRHPRYKGVTKAHIKEYVWKLVSSGSSSLDVSGAASSPSISKTDKAVPVQYGQVGTIIVPEGVFRLALIGGGEAGETYGPAITVGGNGGRGGEIVMADLTLSRGDEITIGAIGEGGYWKDGGRSVRISPTDTAVTVTHHGESGDTVTEYTARGGLGAGGGGAGGNDYSKNGLASLCQYCGGGGGGGPYGTGGAGGASGGAGGNGVTLSTSATAGSDGTIIDGKGYGGAVASSYPKGGGGGGGYGADGGIGGSNSTYGAGGGGGGGAYGGTGGGGAASGGVSGIGHGGIGYGAGGGGAYYYGQGNAGGGGGGGLGDAVSADNGTKNGPGGSGADGGIYLVWINSVNG